MALKRHPRIGDVVRFNEYDTELRPTLLEGKVLKVTDAACLVDVAGRRPPFAVLNIEAEIVRDPAAEVEDLLDTIALMAAQNEGLAGAFTSAQAFDNAQRIGRAKLKEFGR